MLPRSHFPRPLIAIIGLSLAGLLAGCSATTTPPPSAVQSTRAATSSEAPSASLPGAASSGPSDRPEPSVDSHGVPELEALLPAKVGDIPLERVSLTGSDFYSTGTAQTRSRLDELLARLGKSVSDLSVADAGDPRRLAVIEVGAFRVAGAGSTQLLSEWVASNQAVSPSRIKVSNVTIDGRSLTKLVDSGRPVGGTIHVFVKDDIVFLVDADDPVLLKSALAQLPRP